MSIALCFWCSSKVLASCLVGSKKTGVTLKCQVKSSLGLDVKIYSQQNTPSLPSFWNRTQFKRWLVIRNLPESEPLSSVLMAQTLFLTCSHPCPYLLAGSKWVIRSGKKKEGSFLLCAGNWRPKWEFEDLLLRCTTGKCGK